MKTPLNVQVGKRAKVGRVTPYAPGLDVSEGGAPGVTRPTPALMGKAVFLLFSLTFILGLSAHTPPAKHSSDRYLLLVDTSAAMRRRAPAVQKAVSNLLLSSMNAQLQRGDTIGLWTYNEQLYAGRLPLQRWTPEGEQLVASNILAFLDGQPYENASRLDAVWPALQGVVRESKKLTVLIFSEGDETMSGTPFDREINEFFKANASRQKQKRMPFITVLRSYRGQFNGVTLNLAPWPVEFPPFPPESKAASTPKPKPPPEITAPPSAAPPLIVIGKKPEPAVAALPVPAEPTPVTPVVPTNDLPAAVVEPKSPPAPAPTETPQATPGQPAATPVVPAPPAGAIHPKPDVSPVVALPAKPIVEPKPESAPVVVPPTETPHESTPPPVNSAPTPVAPSVHADELKTEPSPLPATVKPPPSPPPAQVVAEAQPETIFSRTKLVLLGLGLVVLAGAVFFLAHRRAHASAHASLITRSMDQDRK